MSAILLVGLTLLGSMSIGAGFGAEGYLGNALLILGGFMFGVVTLICVEDHEKEEN